MPVTLIRLVAAAALAAAAGGCGLGASPNPQPSPSPSPPCTGSPASRAVLGYPADDRAPAAAHFTTDGGVLYATAYDFDRGGLFDFWGTTTGVYIGPADTPPSYDARRSLVTPVTQELSIPENSWVQFDLPAGRYWLLSSNIAKIDIVSCHPQGVTGTPAPTAIPPSARPS